MIIEITSNDILTVSQSNSITYYRPMQGNLNQNCRSYKKVVCGFLTTTMHGKIERLSLIENKSITFYGRRDRMAIGIFDKLLLYNFLLLWHSVCDQSMQ
jgi:hypothetical protein